jgi:penicillin-binding protein 2
VTSTWRQAALGILMAVMLGVLLLRMWFLQVTDVEGSLQVAAAQQLRTVTVEAPRGDIFDRDGRALMAGTKASLRVIIDRQLVSLEDEEALLIPNVSALLGIPASEIRHEFEEHGSGSRFVVGDEISQATALFILENIEQFPGVAVETVPVRVYPLGETAAHVLGYIGAPGESDLADGVITPNDRVGKFGLERQWDRHIRGTPGAITYRVNARGQILGVVDERPPRPGGSVITTIDLELQQLVESTLLQAIQLSRQEGEPVKRASAVVMDPNDGSILAMASVPAFDPALFAEGRISVEVWEAMAEKDVLNNFAIQGFYPPGSSFKPFVYVLALENEISPVIKEQHRAIVERANDPYAFFSDGRLEFEATPTLHDWKPGGHGLVGISESLRQSVNTYYWSVAMAIWENSTEWGEDLLQVFAREFGFGEPTGIDLPFENPGLVPVREWFQHHQQGNTGLVREEGGWSAGDVMNIATGQGALIVTPLQMTVAYAALVNGGTVWEPRVMQTIRDTNNKVVYTNQPNVRNTVRISQATIDLLKQDLNGVVASSSGTARRAFEGFCATGVPDSQCAALRQVGGKTGTAEIRQAIDEDDQDIDTAWFVGVAPLDTPRYVVTVVVDQGGSGGLVAAPAARRILQYLLGETPDPLRRGDDTER